MKVQLQHLIVSLQLSIWLMIAPTYGSKCSNITNLTYAQRSTLRPIVERVFSRKKRFLLLPPGGSLKFTVNVGKRLLAQYPRGFNYAFEAATYYEAFSKRIDLIPKFLRKPTTAKPKSIGPTKPIYVYIPGTEIRYKAQPAKKPAKVQRIDEDKTALQWVNTHPVNKYAGKYADPNHWIKYTKYGNDNYQQKYAWTPAIKKQQQKYHYHPNPSAKWTRWTTTTKPKRWWQKRAVNESDYQPGDSENSYIFHTPSLQHYHGRRDRRQLYQTFEAFSGILGFDMKFCILRAICDCQSLLLPPGYSMMQDMIRAVLTIPAQRGIRDEYTDAMDATVDTCEQKYRSKCPISLINWFMSPMTMMKS